MKLVLVLSALVAVSAAYIVEQDQNTAFNYMERFGVPEAERIRKAEEEYFSSRITGGAPANLGQFPYQPIALPTGSEVNEAFTGVTAVASGFGMLGNNININNNQFLSHVSLQVISNNVCWLSFPLIVQSSNICTSGAGGTSPCRGDSGGPLALTRSGRTILLGITSFGSPQGCESGNPAAFVIEVLIVLTISAVYVKCASD
ncbi:unnamed protein product [Leptidea sinapis]|uniref:Peptidase S1 domain-containing protein n=1 Tax=Leptidea sinapis TaxID=189913 RepID=A0A5E4Q686_9NEOP|nr:unnamed protein product [Leptidea sinapis]